MFYSTDIDNDIIIRNVTLGTQKRLKVAMPFYTRRFLVSLRRYSRSSAKLSEIWSEFCCFWMPNCFFGGGGGPKFMTQSQLHKLVSPSNMCQNLVTIDRATSEIRRGKGRKGKK